MTFNPLFVVSQTGVSPLFQAGMQHSVDIMRFLVQHCGVDVNARDNVRVVVPVVVCVSFVRCKRHLVCDHLLSFYCSAWSICLVETMSAESLR